MCDLPGSGNTHGLCCTTKQSHVSKDFAKKHQKLRSKTSNLVKDSLRNAKMEFKMMMHKERNHKVMGKSRDFDPDHFHQMVFGWVKGNFTHRDFPTEGTNAKFPFFFRNHRLEETEELENLINFGVEQMLATKNIKDKQQLTVEEAQLNQLSLNASSSTSDKSCPKQPSCPAQFSPYRTYDGTCNHAMGKETWGAAKTPMERLLPPAYEDGIWLPRVTSVDGSKLTSARTISRTLFPDFDRPHPTLNLMVMQFGQFLSHDFTQSSSITLRKFFYIKLYLLPKTFSSKADGKRVKCCSDDGSEMLSPHESHFACMPILVDQDDEFYRNFNQRCMNFVRLAIAPDHNCKLGYAKTLSKVTHYIDGSAIYGSDSTTSKALRSFKKGQLKMFVDFNRELLPLNPKPDECIMEGSACFMAGDVRVNQHITLVAVHLLFAREHNRIAEQLHILNSKWSDETIFEESRRIVVAEIQHITYNEWLPLVIGQAAMQQFSLFTQPQGYSSDYDEEINPSMTNEFTGAAFRFGHSTVQGRLFVEFERRLEEIILVSDTFNNPSRFRFQHFYDEILRTLVHQPMQAVDNSVSLGVVTTN